MQEFNNKTCFSVLLFLNYCLQVLNMRLTVPFFIIFLLTACNSVYVKPDSIDKSQIFYADRGGYGMRKSIKQKMDERGYKVVVGKANYTKDFTNNDTMVELDSSIVPQNVRYIVKVNERKEFFNPIWCPLNGFWWWNFNVSIADQKTGEELLTWRGRACQNTALRMMDDIFDKMEIKTNE